MSWDSYSKQRAKTGKTIDSSDFKYLGQTEFYVQKYIRLKNGDDHLLTRGDMFKNPEGDLIQTFCWKAEMYFWNVTKDQREYVSLYDPGTLKKARNKAISEDYIKDKMREITSKMNDYKLGRELRSPRKQTKEQYEADLRRYEIEATARARRARYEKERREK